MNRPLVIRTCLLLVLSVCVVHAEDARKVEPELAPDQALLAKIAALPPNTWLKLPPPKVIGDLDWLAKLNWKSMRQVGPYGRDYSCKMAWMPDRKRAIYAGGGHNIRPLNDVWEYDLAANTWICLYGADVPAQGKSSEWMKANLVIKDGALQTLRSGPPRLSHSFDGWNYDTHRRVAFMPESLRGAVFVSSKPVAEGLGLSDAELAAQWKPAPYFLTFDPYARTWGYLTDNVPKCGRDPSARYISHLKSYWVSSGGAMGLYDPDAKVTTPLSMKGGGGGYGSSSVYVPDTRSIVVIVPPHKEVAAKTWVYTIDTATWTVAQPKAPVGGRSSSGYFDYDSKAKHCVLFTSFTDHRFWIYNVEGNAWTAVETQGDQPSGREVVGYYDPDRDVVVHYGGKTTYVCRLKMPASAETQVNEVSPPPK